MMKTDASPSINAPKPPAALGTIDRTEIQKILLMLREFQKMDSEFPLQYAICLLQIAKNEGTSLTELSQRTGMALSTVSRIVSALSQFRQIGQPYELITVKICEDERRRKELYLTDRGRALITEIVRISRIM